MKQKLFPHQKRLNSLDIFDEYYKVQSELKEKGYDLAYNSGSKAFIVSWFSDCETGVADFKSLWLYGDGALISFVKSPYEYLSHYI